MKSKIDSPLTYNILELPYYQLSWVDLEGLCYSILCDIYGFESVSFYGTRGQNQSGIDLYVRLEDGYLVYQCKNVEGFKKSDLKAAIKKWEDDKWFNDTVSLVIFSSNSLNDSSFIDEFEIQKARLKEKGKNLIKNGSKEIDIILRTRPALVENIFGKDWCYKFCTEDSRNKYLDTNRHNLSLKKNIYPEVPFYITRRFDNSTSEFFSGGYIPNNEMISLFDYLQDSLKRSSPIKIILKAQAASGKSKELENIAFRCSQIENVYPVLIKMVNFKSDIKTYFKAFYTDYDNVPPNQLLLLLDGLDEISNEFFLGFIKEFNLFLQENLLINILASIRSNIYTNQIGYGVDLSNSLKSWHLNELSHQDIECYIDKRIEKLNDRIEFKKLINNPWIKDSIHIPFYLSSIIDIYSEKTIKFPRNKPDMIKIIIKLKIGSDLIKYGDHIPAFKLREFSKKLALYLTLTGKNVIEESLMSKFTSLNIDIVKKCSLFKIENFDGSTTIQFEHNNFQEYIAAVELSHIQWNKLFKIIYYDGDLQIVKPKMFNTVSFLFSIYSEDSECFNSLYSNIELTEPEHLLRFEKDKLSLVVRLKIFKSLILKGKQSEIYYLGGDYRSTELLDFINYSERGFNFLLEELKLGINRSHHQCVLDLICSYNKFKISLPVQSSLLKILKRGLISVGYPEYIYTTIIEILIKFEFYDLNTLNLYIKKCCFIDSKKYRNSILKYILAGNLSSELLFVINSIEILSEEAHGSIYVGYSCFEDCILSFLDDNNILMIIRCFINQNQLIFRIIDHAFYYKDELTINLIYKKLGVIYYKLKQPLVYDAFIEFLVLLNLQSLEKNSWGNPALFFSDCGDKNGLVISLLINPKFEQLNFLLPNFFSSKMALFVIEKYKEGILSKDQICTLRWSLLRNNVDFHNMLQLQLNNEFSDEFKYLPETDWKSINSEREINDIKLLNSREKFLTEVSVVYSLILQKRDLDQDNGSGLSTERYNTYLYEIQNNLSHTIVLRTIKECKIFYDLTLFLIKFQDNDWHKFQFNAVSELLIRNNNQYIPEALMKKCNNFLLHKVVRNIKFDTAIRDNGAFGYHVDNNSVLIVNYLRYGNINLPAVLLLKMLKLDYSGYMDARELKGVKVKHLFQLIYDLVDPVIFKRTILENLTNNKLNQSVLTTHSLICKQYNYFECNNYILKFLSDNKFNARLKIHLVDVVIYFNGSSDVFDFVIDKWKSISNDWQLSICRHLSLFPEHTENLLSLFDNSDFTIIRLSEDLNFKYDLILEAIKQGSKNVIIFLFAYLEDYPSALIISRLKMDIFNVLISNNSTWLLQQCFILLSKCAYYINDIRPNELVEVLELIIRSCCINNKIAFDLSIRGYERIIMENIIEFPEITYLRWCKRRLTKVYYSTVSSYENETEAWDIINQLNLD